MSAKIAAERADAHFDDAKLRATLAAVGEAAYRWSIADDRLEWSAGAADLFGIGEERLATGAAYAALLDPDSLIGRSEVVLNAIGSDTGEGVPYEVEYALAPRGRDGPSLWVEDVGRWYSDGGRRPVRAVGIVRRVDERHRREQRLAHLSRYDALTGFFSRGRLLDILDETIADVKRFRGHAAFLLVAIDEFTLFNDLYGFETGDRLFLKVAQRIRARLRAGDAIGRYSGSKLGLVLMNCDESDMRIAAERFGEEIAREVIDTGTASIAPTVSIGGVALPRYGRDREETLARVEVALREARLQGRGRFAAFFPSEVRETAQRENMAVSNELVAALKEKRLALAYQPIVGAEDRKPAFHEALLRLRREDGTVVTAGKFLPLAEQLGLARLFDETTLSLALATLEKDPAAILSVNVSPETSAAPQWLSALATAASGRSGLAERLIVEITESAIIRNIEETTRFVAMLHDLGARVAIDDFGAGYTSFRNLRLLGVDYVKIDGSYCENIATSPEDRTFVKALASLARDLGIRTVAEWVQDEEAAAILAEFGIDYLQGELVGAPAMSPPWSA